MFHSFQETMHIFSKNSNTSVVKEWTIWDKLHSFLKTYNKPKNLLWFAYGPVRFSFWSYNFLCFFSKQEINLLHQTAIFLFSCPGLWKKRENNLEENDMHVSVTVLFSSDVITEYSITSNEQVRLTTSTSLQWEIW
jgi:hypothetical protein